jgi:tetratricopeptide (TPR) repeat protein
LTAPQIDIADETSRAFRAFAAGRHVEAAEHARRVLRSAPEDPAALTLIGRVALIDGRPEVAGELFEHVLSKHPDNASLWLDLSRAFRDVGQYERAIDAARRASKLEPNAPPAWIALGELHLWLNDSAEATAAFERALKTNPDSVAACRGICQVKEIPPDSPLVVRMTALIAAERTTPRERAELHYTLAQVYRRAGAHDEFIRHLLAANATQRTISTGDRAQYDAVFDRLESAFTKTTFLKAAHARRMEPTPLFVLGMPRSGTTLVERLLASARGVAAGGELNYVVGPLRRDLEARTGRAFPLGYAELSTDELTSLAQGYTQRLALVGQGVPIVIDKTPGNYQVLGLLGRLFPSSKVVHVSRDPMATCFSILQYPFSDRSPHTCDVQLLAHAYARYLRLMHRWRELCGDAFITVSYERLVEAPADESRRMFEYCALDWNPEFLDPSRRRGAVRTFSATQVRRPIYADSVGAWREFANELAPLTEALERELSNVSSA